MRNIVKFIASFCFIGYIPYASGTIASAVSVVLIYRYVWGTGFFSFLLILLLITGYLTSSRAAYIFNHADPPQVVIDEVIGMLVALLFIPKAIGFYLIAFILFRIFDIVKPPPIKRIEHLRGAVGIMTDDIMAGLYANIITQLIVRLVL